MAQSPNLKLKLLVDSVQSSKFITHKKTLALIRKIESLASVYDAQLLQRQVYVRNRAGASGKGLLRRDRHVRLLQAGFRHVHRQ
ncbi:MAG: hypothetical protein ACI3VD_04750 [Candidatus Limivicinus sp.]